MWTEKFKPRKLEEFMGQEKAVLQLKNFIQNYSKQAKKAAFLYGPVGTGKTCLVYALADSLELDVLELNASEFRDKEKILARIKPALESRSLFSQGRIILLDDINAIARDDAGGIQAILSLMERSKVPFIFTANSPWNQNLAELRQKSMLIEMKKFSNSEILKILSIVCNKIKLKISSGVFEIIILKSRGDARAAINDLETISGLDLTGEEASKLLGDREKEENIFGAIRNVFKSQDASKTLGAFENVALTQDECILWIDENLPLEYSAEELAKAYESLSKADIFRRRIMRQQHWRFLVYINSLITAGVAVARLDKQRIKSFTPYKQASRVLKIWQSNQRYAKRKTIIEKLAHETHSSKKKVMREMPFLQIILKDEEAAAELKLTEEEKEFLRMKN